MSNPKINTGNSYTGKITFIDHHLPALEAGAYTVEAWQTVKSEESARSIQEFVVSAPRFSLSVDQIHSHFPPRGGVGLYEGIIPTLGIRRNTLPWERSPFKNSTTKGSSWLALLLVTEDELTSGKVKEVYADEQAKIPKKIKDVQSTLGMGQLEDWYDENMGVNVLELDNDLYHSLLPKGEDLKWLSHNRQNKNKEGEKQGELSYIISHRIPTVDALNTVYLVSIEHRYADEEATSPELIDSDNDEKQQLVWLYKWQFYCKPEMLYSYKVTPAILQKATEVYPSLQIPAVDTLSSWLNKTFEDKNSYEELKGFLMRDLINASEDTVNFILVKAKKAQGTFEHILKTTDVDSLKDPLVLGGKVSNESAKNYLANGSAVLKHHLRSGGKTYSWYKGPLSSFPQEDKAFPYPVSSADELLTFDRATGMFDTTYSAAWALGHFKGMEEKGLATALYRWRHKKRHSQLARNHPHDASHLPQEAPSDTDFPEAIVQKLDQWKILKGLPFNYLVPKRSMLPKESLRFFYLDPNWLRALIDGFFSVGKVSGVDDREEEMSHFPGFSQPITGMLLRSAAVAGWPSMHLNPYAVKVEGNEYDASPKPMVPIIRKSYLQKEILLVLFQGVPKTLDFYLSPEGLHSGFELDDSDLSAPKYTHRISHPVNGNDLTIPQVEAISNGQGNRTYNTFSAADLAKNIQTQIENYRDNQPDNTIPADFRLTSGHFGMELIKGAPLVRIQLG